MYSSAPPPDYGSTRVLTREEKFAQLIGHFEISQLYAKKLQSLNNFKVVLLLDDSGSMRTHIEDCAHIIPSSVFRPTRWDELKQFSTMAVDIANLFNNGGTNVYFLNRPPMRNVIEVCGLAAYFDIQPTGATPLAIRLQEVIDENPSTEENKMLIIIVTDGEPSDQLGRMDIEGFKNVIKTRPNSVYTSIVACTSGETGTSVLAYLNQWDKKYKRLDVVDDFVSEKKEIFKRGLLKHFSYGDYVVKTMVGSIDSELDNSDELACCCLL
jgi:uncharacterized protein with von Willebrand factor type A (vWA) domain